jgi:hypothetical protein
MRSGASLGQVCRTSAASRGPRLLDAWSANQAHCHLLTPFHVVQRSRQDIHRSEDRRAETVGGHPCAKPGWQQRVDALGQPEHNRVLLAKRLFVENRFTSGCSAYYRNGTDRADCGDMAADAEP